MRQPTPSKSGMQTTVFDCVIENAHNRRDFRKADLRLAGT